MSINRQVYKNNNKGKVKRRLRRKRILLWIVMPILLLIIGATAYGGFLYNKAESVMNKSYKPIERDTKAKANVKLENTSILFIGVDDSEKRKSNGRSRSDALMLATFNKKEKSIKLLSIPRDSYVHIPEKDIYTKITHAHAYGGVKLTLETVEELLDVPVDYYVKMNFNAFIDVINALDGVKVDVPFTFSEQDSQDHAKAITLKKGVQELDGEQALAFARTRKMDSDIQRGQRQQQIFKAILSKGSSIKSISNYTDVMEAVGKNMSTDLTFDQMKSFISYIQAGSGIDVESLSLKGSDSYIDRVYYYQLDETALEETKSTLKTHLNSTNTASATKVE
ncbi:LytR family transcriptional regulator [Priestia megaterium]|jgi:polyisoprenyl-teichoic acid--peptidoglycan teichoic acid transferase|uniref:LytR family transcriptional regulator n=1 Tax=Priestia megaterium TaxID=1404 RepID=A0A6H1PB63_PRIMG|nr:LCP family protein [Priestia megaterium]QIZ10617.1 LytR family transcriptional regulator [Priestia megaterium]